MMVTASAASPMNGLNDKGSPTTAATALEETTNSTVKTPPRKRSCRILPPTQGETTVEPSNKNDDVNGTSSSSTNDQTMEKKAKKTKKAKEIKEEQEDMDWICSQCKEAECMIDPEATEFLLCDGKCNRIFHVPCAGLSEVPQGDDDWFCRDCTNNRHQCAICQEFGQDDEDVFLCSKDKCGLFFHESCLSMQNVDVTMVKKGGTNISTTENGQAMEQDEEEAEMATIPVFTCPAHSCWTCTQTIHEDTNKAAEEEDAATTPNGKKSGKKKRGKKKPKRSIQSLYFQCKTTSRLFRCLECPRAFHLTCMPPSARFHELAILCHEHAMTHKLPELDIANSIQSSVEDKIDRNLLKLNRQNKRRKGDGFKDPLNCANRFFHGMRGDRLISEERYLFDSLSGTTGSSSNNKKATKDTTVEDLVQKAATSFDLDADLRFCLPCDLKDEVHSKPPSYKHVHSLQYDPNNRPKKISTGERCQCTGTCDERCLNRLSMIECCGEGKASNCAVGDKCGNRAMGKRLSAKCKPKREGGKGWGLVAVKAIKKGMLVQEYMGEVIDERTKEQRLGDWAKEHPNDPNFYIMALPSNWYIDARHEANLSRFINHSCGPNCKLETINVRGYMRCGIYAKRDISPGEFLSYDYHFDTKHADKFVCRCGAANCRGTMKGGEKAVDESASKKLKALALKEAKAKMEADRKFLEDLKNKDTKSLVDALVPAAEQPFEAVSSGPQDRYRADAVRNRLFLWRNANSGADYANRCAVLDSRDEALRSGYALGSSTASSPVTNSDAKSEDFDALAIVRKHNGTN